MAIPFDNPYINQQLGGMYQPDFDHQQQEYFRRHVEELKRRGAEQYMISNTSVGSNFRDYVEEKPKDKPVPTLTINKKLLLCEE